MLVFCTEPGGLQLVTPGDKWDTLKDLARAVVCIALLIHGAWHE